MVYSQNGIMTKKVFSVAINCSLSNIIAGSMKAFVISLDHRPLLSLFLQKVEGKYGEGRKVWEPN